MLCKTILPVLLLSLTTLGFGRAPEEGAASVALTAETPDSPPSGFTGPIQDNSFLVEEAYNQEDGVVQHISFFERLATGEWAFTQTDEWPLRSLKHQLSLTMTASQPGADPSPGAGWGDTFINYRYQLVGSGDAMVAIAPRVSLLLPTGSAALGRGVGGVGLQTLLPISIQHNRYLVTNWNVGATWIPRAQNDLHQRANALDINLGQSFVWLVKPRFNALLETVWYSNVNVTSAGTTARQQDLYVSPGIRWAYNFKKNDLQIVPGVGFPLGIGPSAGQKGFIVYLSFEHALAFAHSR